MDPTVPIFRPSKPFPQHVLGKYLTEPHHHAVDEWEEKIDGQ